MTDYPKEQLRNIIEAGLLVASRPMTLAQLEGLFEHEDNRPERDAIRDALNGLIEEYESRGIELVEVASGWRMQSREAMSPWIANLFQEKAPRYSRALLETLVLVAYRQPITRGEIEDIRGVAVSSNIVKTLIERDWVKVVGHRDVPGRPALLGTTRQFLDYFNLKKIGELPTLSEIKALDEIAPELAEEVAMLDATLSPDGEATAGLKEEIESDESDGEELQEQGGSEALDQSSQQQLAASSETAESVETAEKIVAVDVELSSEDDESADDDDGMQGGEDGESPESAGFNAADEGIPDDEPGEEGAPEAAPNAESSTKTDADINNASEDIQPDEEDLAAVAEATIDAMSTIHRPETELLH